MTPADDATPTLAAQIEALAPCPFCGEQNASIEHSMGVYITHRCGGRVDRPLVRVVAQTYAQAADAWNTRPAIVTALRQAEKCDLCHGSGRNGASQLWPDYPPACRACNGSGTLPATSQAEAVPGVTIRHIHLGPDGEMPHRAMALADENTHLRETLAWYGEQARLARLIHSEGDTGRNALAGDGGKRANEALARQHGAREDGDNAPSADAGVVEDGGYRLEEMRRCIDATGIVWGVADWDDVRDFFSLKVKPLAALASRQPAGVEE